MIFAERSEIELTIGRAILDRRLVRIEHRMRSRLLEPWALGYGARGDLVLQAWRRDADEDGWLLIPLVDIRRVEALDERVGARRPALLDGQRRMPRLLVQMIER
ncbi:hypothetical protein [Salinarimonas ramus]|uniref:Uncharacterized protein n=1 Tax=Salinarimonas ramus TaxID=690164 RepID=A0A917V9Z7_9HYPH|nr:hypothetical protein [Salinarimonas ramus]GGK55260.1 hypothetical protein GCM10011322_47410 [Salinarimonas ramus]